MWDFQSPFNYGGGRDHFQLDCCKLIFHCGNEYKKHLDYVVDYLRADDSSAFVFTNRRKLSFEMVAGLEEKLDKHSVTGDVLHIHGRLKREDKGNLINLFT